MTTRQKVFLLVPGQDIYEHSGDAKILVLPGPGRELWPKNRKWVVLGAIFQKLQMWIVFLWLDLHDWSFQGCYKALWNTNFEPLKFTKFDHQVALRPLFTFSFLAVLAMFLTGLSRFFSWCPHVLKDTTDFVMKKLGPLFVYS